MSDSTPPNSPSRPSGLVVGGRGGPADELLEDGQEEVFSRTEVELGATEHQAAAGGGGIAAEGPDENKAAPRVQPSPGFESAPD